MYLAMEASMNESVFFLLPLAGEFSYTTDQIRLNVVCL